MKIGIIGAMEEEIRVLLTALENKKTTRLGKRDFHEGLISGHPVVLVFSRWGKVAASSSVTTLIHKFEVDILIFTGIAGAIDRRLEPGDFVIADRLIQHDMDVSKIGIERYEIPLLGKKYFETDPILREKAIIAAEEYIRENLVRDLGPELLNEFNLHQPRVLRGTIASGDQFIGDDEINRRLNETIDQLMCVEMEGAAVAQVAWEHDIPFVVIRTISDKADHSAHLDFPSFVAKVASHLTAGVVSRLLMRL